MNLQKRNELYYLVDLLINPGNSDILLTEKEKDYIELLVQIIKEIGQIDGKSVQIANRLYLNNRYG